MKDGMDVAIVNGVFGLVGALIGVIGALLGIWWNHRLSDKRTPKSSGPFGKTVLNWLELTESARKKLGRSKFIPIDGTGRELPKLVGQAKAEDSILAICGHKGSYSIAYYKANFTNCKEVKRVFSYEAILSEIKTKKTAYALKGLKAHLNMRHSSQCDVETLLIPAEVSIGNFKLDKFNPPLSFGLAILVKSGGSPKKAIVHWEIDAEPLGQLIGIEGVIIDGNQRQLLKELVYLHKRIARADGVLSSKRHWKEIDKACAELDNEWKQHQPPQNKERERMTVGIIGAGFVGAACAKAMLLRGSCDHIILNDVIEGKAKGLANDLSHGEPLCPATRIKAGPITQLAGAKIIVITAGINERSGHAIDRSDKRGRLLLLPDNTKIYKDIAREMPNLAPDAVILVVTDPPDALADVARHLIPGARIVSTGTFLDSLRFRLQIARQLSCNPASVDANVIGEHGTSQVYVWSNARVGDQDVLSLVEARHLDPSEFRRRVEESVKYANIEIIEGTGASQHGIGIVTARLVEAILRDERFVAPVGTYHAQYGVTLSLPSVIDSTGVSEVLIPTLEEAESRALTASAEALRDAVEGVSHLLKGQTGGSA